MAQRSWVVPDLGKVPDEGTGYTYMLSTHPFLPQTGVRDTHRAFTSNTEDLFNIPRVVTMQGIQLNTECVTIDQADDMEILSMHVENSVANQPLNYIYDGTVINATIALINPGWQYQRIFGVVLGSTNTTLPIGQRIDRAYKG